MGIGESQLLKQLSRGNFLAVYHVTSVVSRKNLANAIALQLFQFFELLGKEGEFHGLANFHATRLRAELALNDIEQRRFASTVRTQKAIAVTRTDHPGNIIENLVLPVGERGVDHVNALLSQSRNSSTLKFCGVTKRRLFRNKGTCRFNMKTWLARTRPSATGKKCQFTANKVLSFLFRHLGLALTLHPLENISGIATLKWFGDAIVHFPHAKAYLVEEPAVVRYYHQGASAS